MRCRNTRTCHVSIGPLFTELLLEHTHIHTRIKFPGGKKATNIRFYGLQVFSVHKQNWFSFNARRATNSMWQCKTWRYSHKSTVFAWRYADSFLEGRTASYTEQDADVVSQQKHPKERVLPRQSLPLLKWEEEAAEWRKERQIALHLRPFIRQILSRAIWRGKWRGK